MVSRLARYVWQMFPPHVMLPAGVASFYAIYGSLQALAGPGRSRLTPGSALGAATVVLLMLLLRVFDELKDADSDRSLAAAGDPRYRDRPIVTGVVTEADLRSFSWVLVVVLVALNLALGVPWPFLAFVAVLATVWASSRWFFYPRIRHSLLWAFATHSPLTLVVGLYVVAVYTRDFGPALHLLDTAALLVGTWAPIAAWETSRKIRVRADETAYETYSQLFGERVAPLVPVAFVVLSLACLGHVAAHAGFPLLVDLVFVTAAAVFVARALAFSWRPRRALARLQPWSEAYALAVTLGLCAAAWWR